MKILGISCFYHDSAASIIINSQIVAAVQEERFTRKKHTPNFPINSIKYCLEETGFKIKELDAIVFYDKPIVKFERLISTFYATPKGLIQFINQSYMVEEIFKKINFDNEKLSQNQKNEINLLFRTCYPAASSFIHQFQKKRNFNN